MKKNAKALIFRSIVVGVITTVVASAFISIIGNKHKVFSDEEFNAISIKIKSDSELKKKIGNILEIDKNIDDSEKEETDTYSKGNYHFETHTDKGKYDLEINWKMNENRIENLEIDSIQIKEMK